MRGSWKASEKTLTMSCLEARNKKVSLVGKMSQAKVWRKGRLGEWAPLITM